MITAADSLASLRQLAQVYGVEAAYEDGLGQQSEPTPETLIAVLGALGVQIDSPDDAPAALREHSEAMMARAVEPIVVAWEGVADLDFRGSTPSSRPIDCSIVLEDGTTREWRIDGAGAERPVGVVQALPYGYHRLTIDDGKANRESLIISAPRKAYSPPGAERGWGVFAPLYAIHSSESWGIGDFADLRKLLDWTSTLGGTTVATLPLLAAFTGGIAGISPYSPASRLFWNELYIDVSAVPELTRSAAAREIVASPGFQTELEALRSSSIVDYEGVAALKRRVLQPLSASIREDRSARGDAFRSFAAENPRVAPYARFRAACERHRSGWRGWPERQRDGVIAETDIDPAAYIYHAYVQWIVGEQIRALSNEAKENGNQIYLDMPLGVHADSYDTWSERASFADGVTAGAPPDVVFTSGQNWGFPPSHPEGARGSDYSYLIASLRHVMRHASVLRIDHIAGLHRLFWIPAGMDSSEGAYVHYPADELYALLTLESHRHRTMLVGEDLGNIPDYVRPAMADHGVLRSYVLEYELAGGELPFKPGVGAVASVNTHDMEPFAGFWLDANSARGRSVLIERLADEGLVEGDVNLAEAQHAANTWLASSEAPTVLISVEDLWHETERQNVPGTDERAAELVPQGAPLSRRDA